MASYDFTTSAAQAFGSNLSQLEPNVWGIYSGDINQDGVIDGSDSTQLINDIENAAFGNLTTDLNGDGAVDNSDTTFFYNNVENSVFSNQP